MHTKSMILATILSLAILTPGFSVEAGAAANDEAIRTVLDRLEWRNIGPAIMSGRIDDFAVVESNPHIAYVGTASSGIWKTSNNGVTWKPMFDDEPLSSIGDLAVAPSDPSILYAGTGEPANRQSSSWGNGVYKSTDGGDTWHHMGLDDTLHIGRVRIHPTNPDIVYVAAIGHLWGPNPERGLYKTTDGGKTWTNTLFIDENTGFIDLAMDPESPDTLYAAAYQRRRRAFGFAGSGPGSGLYKTTDGGENWTRLTDGLPPGDNGRIGIDIYRKDPRIVYAIVQNEEGGIFRSEDKGVSWTKMSDTNPRPMYYSQIRIDPLNDQRIWVLGSRMYYSEDGGKNFTTERVTRIHGDHHALWINPSDSNHMLLGSDGGIHYSYDRGLTWDFVNTFAIGQFYEVGYDMETPYNIYGGLQDNGSWGGPSRTLYEQGITNEDWFRVGGGDGFYTQVDPTDPTTIYVESQNGNLRRLSLKTTETKTIRPNPPGGESRYRFDWNSPILISPHDPRTIYYGGNHLFKSTDRGDVWTKSPDLTRNMDRDEMPIMGVMVTDETLSRHDGISTFGQIISITESPLRQGVVYAGTDDGNLQVTRDGGDTWTNVSGKLTGVPDGTYVSRVAASHHADGRVYATLDGHRNDDYGVYALVSEDYGNSWKSIAGGLPAGHTLNVIREHHRSENLLFAGGEFGVYVSFDRGGEWHELRGNFPRVPVDDIAIHPRENDLILGTHGRAIWVLDDMAPLESISASLLESELHVFPVREATAYRMYRHKANTGHKMFVAPNPPEGALVHYYLSEEPAEDEELRIEILADGKVIRTLEGPHARGLNRTNWDLRHEPPVPATGQGGFGGPPPGPRALPGSYTVRVSLGDQSRVQTVRVQDDPRIQISAADRKAHFDTLMRLSSLISTMDEAHKVAEALKEQLTSLDKSLEQLPEKQEAVAEVLKTTSEKVGESEKMLSRNEGRQGFGGGGSRPLFQRMTRLFRALDGYTEAPSQDSLERVEYCAGELNERIAEFNQVLDVDVAGLNEVIAANQIPRIFTAKRVSPTSP